MNGILLETERLRLRRFTAADALHLYDLDNDPAVMRYINGGIPTPRQVIARDILPRFRRYDARRPELGFWAAEDRTSGVFLGWFSFRPTDDTPDQVTLGFRLRRAAWGRGLATEGGRALIRLAFTRLSVQRVVATTYEENLASRRVLEKLGLRPVRRFRLTPADLQRADTFHAGAGAAVWDGDDIEYALAKETWGQRP